MVSHLWLSHNDKNNFEKLQINNNDNEMREKTIKQNTKK